MCTLPPSFKAIFLSLLSEVFFSGRIPYSVINMVRCLVPDRENKMCVIPDRNIVVVTAICAKRVIFSDSVRYLKP